MRKIRFLISFLCFLIFFSCGEPAAVTEVSERDAGFVVLSTFDEGTILNPGKEIEYFLSFSDYSEVKAVSFEIAVTDLINDEPVIKGEKISLETSSFRDDSLQTQGAQTASGGGSESGFSSEYDYTGTVAVPEGLADGYYAFEFYFFDESGKNIGSVSASFFVSSASLKVNSIGSYPAIIYPGGECLLYTDISAPDGFDSDVVWLCNGIEIYRCRLKELPPAVKWQAPKDKSAVEMAVGIYPSDPPVGETFSFVPPVSLASTIFISSNQSSESSDFRPDSEYDLLFHFRGEMNDYSPYSDGRTVSVKGTPQLAFDSNIFGYAFDNDAALEIETDAAPLLTEKGMIDDPFVFDFRMNLRSSSSGNILSVKDPSARTILSLAKEKSMLRFSADFPSGPLSQSLNLDDYRLSERQRLSLSVFPDPGMNRLVFLWSIDGYSVARSVFGYEVAEVFPKYTLEIGGENGYTGVIDELGLFRVGSREFGSVFNETVKKKYREKCLFADDFTCRSEVSAFYRSFPDVPVLGSVNLPAGSRLETIAYPVPEEGLSVQLDVSDEQFSGGNIGIKVFSSGNAVVGNSEETVIMLNLTEAVIRTGSVVKSYQSDLSLCGLYRFDFKKDAAGGWVCLFGGKAFAVTIPEDSQIAVSVWTGETESLSLNSLVLLSASEGQADLYKVPVSPLWQE